MDILSLSTLLDYDSSLILLKPMLDINLPLNDESVLEKSIA